jgi:CDP-diacylglycerol--glycerol-3-phosphate 3-phosphatidyltransferase
MYRKLRKQREAMDFFLRTSFLGSVYQKTLQNVFMPRLNRAGLTPNQLTLIGTALAALVPMAFLIHPLIGLLVLSASGIADSLDGLLAREQKQVSSFGAFLDSSLDRLSDFFYLTGFWVLFWPLGKPLPASAVIFAALLLTLMISYVKARAEALGARCQVGLMERGARVVYLLFWALLLCILPGHILPVLWAGLLVYCGLTLATVVQRMRHIRAQMAAPRPPEH